jgi:hypothetical protein
MTPQMSVVARSGRRRSNLDVTLDGGSHRLGSDHYPLRENPVYHDREQLCLTRSSGTRCCSSLPDRFAA